MSSIDGAQIEIINWDKYNPRKDVKASSWFRMDHGLFENPDFYDFTQGELLVWIYLLCVTSRKSTPVSKLNLSHAERIGRLKEKDIDSAIKKLQSLQILHVDVTGTVRERDVDDTRACATDGRDETNEHARRTRSEYSQAFEDLYGKYPRKEGKSKGHKIYAKLSLEEKSQVVTAVENYARRMAGSEYLKHFSTFMGEWSDWLDASTGTIQTSAPKLRVKSLEEL